jgi:hypothetical protein
MFMPAYPAPKEQIAPKMKATVGFQPRSGLANPRRTNIKAGDIVTIEPLDDHSFKVNILDFTPETLENDPAWQAIHKPAKAKRRNVNRMQQHEKPRKKLLKRNSNPKREKNSREAKN